AMHELSIALSIVELAEEEAEARGGCVRAVHLKLGPLSGVVKEAILSAYEIACQNTSLEGSRLLIDEVPVIAYCSRCDSPRTLASPQWLVCPDCEHPVSHLTQGRELLVTALEISEPVPA